MLLLAQQRRFNKKVQRSNAINVMLVYFVLLALGQLLHVQVVLEVECFKEVYVRRHVMQGIQISQGFAQPVKHLV